MKDLRLLKVISINEAELLYRALHRYIFDKGGLLDTEKDKDKLIIPIGLYEELKVFINQDYET